MSTAPTNSETEKFIENAVNEICLEMFRTNIFSVQARAEIRHQLSCAMWRASTFTISGGESE